MKKIELLLLLAGLTMFAILLRQMDFTLVLWSLKAVGWGFLLIFVQEIVAFVFNSLGWKLSIEPSIAKQISFKSLLKMRISGDGINYLTPSATLAGEWAKTAMMGQNHSFEHRFSSVALSKITQAIAMALISLGGIFWAIKSKINISNLETLAKNGGWILLGVLLLIVVLEIRASKLKKKENPEATVETKKSVWQSIKSVDRHLLEFIRNYPFKTVFSILCFAIAYFWGAFEAFWICRFIGVPISIKTAILIEMLSVFMDGIFFAVPGKAGTQETTKVAIFTALGFKATNGFAFAIIRHIRELVWAIVGFSMYYEHRGLLRFVKCRYNQRQNQPGNKSR
jgi:uncharacterized membrane protein YbhN (UPF0104 family)